MSPVLESATSDVPGPCVRHWFPIRCEPQAWDTFRRSTTPSSKTSTCRVRPVSRKRERPPLDDTVDELLHAPPSVSFPPALTESGLLIEYRLPKVSDAGVDRNISERPRHRVDRQFARKHPDQARVVQVMPLSIAVLTRRPWSGSSRCCRPSRLSFRCTQPPIRWSPRRLKPGRGFAPA